MLGDDCVNTYLSDSYKRKKLVYIIIFVTCSILLLSGLKKIVVYEIKERKPAFTGEIKQVCTYVSPYFVPCEYVYDENKYVGDVDILQEGCAGTKINTVMTTFIMGRCRSLKLLILKLTWRLSQE